MGELRSRKLGGMAKKKIKRKINKVLEFVILLLLELKNYKLKRKKLILPL